MTKTTEADELREAWRIAGVQLRNFFEVILICPVAGDDNWRRVYFVDTTQHVYRVRCTVRDLEKPSYVKRRIAAAFSFMPRHRTEIGSSRQASQEWRAEIARAYERCQLMPRDVSFLD